PAIERVLASLGASHTGHYTADQLDYYELANIFQFNFRRELSRLFPPDGRITYAGIGIASELIDGKRFVTDVYDGAPAASAGVKRAAEQRRRAGSRSPLPLGRRAAGRRRDLPRRYPAVPFHRPQRRGPALQRALAQAAGGADRRGHPERPRGLRLRSESEGH